MRAHDAWVVEYGGNVRRDAGCRMFPTALEAEETRRQLLDQSRSTAASFVEIDWIPNGAPHYQR